MSSPVYLDSFNLQHTIQNALENSTPLSIVRIGDGENIVLAQDVILSREEYMRTSVGRHWPHHGSGVRLPDPIARDLVINSLMKVDLIGILPYNDRRIRAPKKYKRALTDRVFEYYNIEPKATFDAYLFRNFLTTVGFWEAMRGKKILIISKWGDQFTNRVQSYEETWDFTIVKALTIRSFYEVDLIMSELDHVEFDVALLAAGVGSIVMAQRIADQYGKVAIDVGKGLTLIALGLRTIPQPPQNNV